MRVFRSKISHVFFSKLICDYNACVVSAAGTSSRHGSTHGVFTQRVAWPDNAICACQTL